MREIGPSTSAFGARTKSTDESILSALGMSPGLVGRQLNPPDQQDLRGPLMSLAAANIRLMGANKKSDDGSSFAFFILLFLLFLIVAWPYLLGTWLAVQLGAENPSTARSVAGWFLEVLWLGGLAALAANGWLKAKRKEQEERRLQLEKQQRKAEFGSAGAELYEQAVALAARIAESEAARSGWLGNPADFDFRADLRAIAVNLRRAEEIRKVVAEASSIKHFTPADTQMLDDARRAVARLETSVRERVTLIGECERQAADIDRQFSDDRERGEMAKRREDLRRRLGPMVYGAQTMPAEVPSESADVVKARVAAFHELKALIDKYRVDADAA